MVDPGCVSRASKAAVGACERLPVLSACIRLRHLRQSEIHDLDLPARGDEDVRRLDVAMHHALGVRRIQRVRNLDGQIQQFVQLERRAADLCL